MNRFNILHWTISGKLLLGFGVMIFILSALFAAASFSGATRINEQNLELYIAEKTSRSRERIQTVFETLLIELDNSLAGEATAQILYNALVLRNDVSATNYLRDIFLPTRPDVLVGAWLLNVRTGAVVAQAVVENKTLPFENPDQSSSLAYQKAQTLTVQQPRGLVSHEVLRADGQRVPVLELVEVVINNNNLAVGYLVVAIDAEALFTPLLGDNNVVGAYSYLVAPSGSSYLAHPQTRARVDVSLADVTEILSQQPARRTLTYVVGTGNAQREVLGYYETVDLFGLPFSLVTELERQRVTGQIIQYSQEVIFPLIVGGGLLVVMLTVLLNLLITPPLTDVTSALRTMLRGGMDAPVRGKNRMDEIGQLVTAFTDMRQQVRQFTATMEQRLKERDRDLRVTQDISRAITDERDLQMLMNTVVNLIVSNFSSIYHAQIFLVDSQGFAVLRASTGEPGQALLASGHRLAVGSISVIGQVVEQGQVIIARDAAFSDVHRRNEFLPDTRAELAIPLRTGERVVGALDVQSKHRDSFAPDLVNVLQTLAGQVSIALENVRLYEESQRQLAAIDQQRRDAARQDWRTYLNTNRQPDLTMSAGNHTQYDFAMLRRQALASGKPAVGALTPHRTIPFVVPIQLRGETLGMVDCEVPERDFRYDRVLLAEELVNRLSIGLDNARLFEESQQAAERERMVNTISAKITQQTDIEAILQTVLHEVGVALRTPQVAVRLHLPAFEPRQTLLPVTNGAQSHPQAALPETETVVE